VIGLSIALISAKNLADFEAPAGKYNFQALSLEEPILFTEVSFYAGLVLAAPLLFMSCAALSLPV